MVRNNYPNRPLREQKQKNSDPTDSKIDLAHEHLQNAVPIDIFIGKYKPLGA